MNWKEKNVSQWYLRLNLLDMHNWGHKQSKLYLVIWTDKTVKNYIYSLHKNNSCATGSSRLLMPCLANMHFYNLCPQRSFSLQNKCEEFFDWNTFVALFLWYPKPFSWEKYILTSHMSTAHAGFTLWALALRCHGCLSPEEAAYFKEIYISSSVKHHYSLYSGEACYICMTRFAYVICCARYVSGTSRQAGRVPSEQENFSPRSRYGVGE